ncbi:fluoride efflux transporter CrcB [Paenibacillus tarimensis]
MSILFLTIGGSAGAVLRYLLGIVMMRRYPSPPLPIAMLTVNLLGSLGLGVFFGLKYGKIPIGAYAEPAYLLLGIGFFGAFTTFSTFSVEAMQLLRNRKWKSFAVYLILSICGSIGGFLLGINLGMSIYGS